MTETKHVDWKSYLADSNNKDFIHNFMNSVNLDQFLAKVMVQAMANDLQNKGLITLNDIQIKQAIEVYIESFPASLEIQRMIFSHWDDPNYNFGRPDRVNTIWDAKILSVVGRSINKHKILLITNDNDMRIASEKTTSGCLIMSLSEYLKILNLSI